MNVRSIAGITILGALLAAPLVEAQTQPLAPEFESSASIPDAKLAALNSAEEVPLPEVHAILPKPKSPVHFSKTGFLLLSAGVYTASLADMHQTLVAKKSPWWYEADPLARPLVRLPTPAYSLRIAEIRAQILPLAITFLSGVAFRFAEGHLLFLPPA